MRRAVTIAAGVTGAVVLALILVRLEGSGEADVALAGGTAVQLTGTNFDMQPDEVSRPAGQITLTLTLSSTGMTTHNLSIQGTSKDVSGSGNFVSTTLNLADGAYPYFCRFHPISMRGTLTVGTGPPPPPPPVPPPPVPPPPVPPPPVPPPPAPGDMPKPPDDPGTPVGTGDDPQPGEQGSTKLKRVKLAPDKKRGAVILARVKCSNNAAGQCSGNVLFKATVPTRLLAAQAATAAKKKITLGKRRFSIAAGKAENIAVPLRKPARKIFAKIRRLRGVKVIVRASDDDGKLPRATKTVALRAGKAVRAALS